MKIVVLDGYAANPGDLSWEELKQLGALTIYDRTPQELVVERSLEAEAVLVNKVSLTRELIMQQHRPRGRTRAGRDRDQHSSL